jgi:secreted trypsin-like serine protease
MKITKVTLFLSLFASINSNAASSDVDDMPFQGKLINGEVVEANAFPEILNLEISGSRCTATVIGPRVILTAAHCRYGAIARFTISGRSYTAELVRPRNFENRDSNSISDLALGYVSSEIENVKPVTVGGSARSGTQVLLFGYGCHTTNRRNDGKLRRGTNVIQSASGQRFKIYSSATGTAACYGDSGGPSFLRTGSKLQQIGVHSRGNIRDMTLDTRLDTRTATSFMKSFAQRYQTDICGVTVNCP